MTERQIRFEIQFAKEAFEEYQDLDHSVLFTFWPSENAKTTRFLRQRKEEKAGETS